MSKTQAPSDDWRRGGRGGGGNGVAWWGADIMGTCKACERPYQVRVWFGKGRREGGCGSAEPVLHQLAKKTEWAMASVTQPASQPATHPPTHLLTLTGRCPTSVSRHRRMFNTAWIIMDIDVHTYREVPCEPPTCALRC